MTLSRRLCFAPIVVASLVFGPGLKGWAAGPAAAPNFVVILTDDQGWVDSSVRMMRERDDSRDPFLRTPHLERLARRGIVFSNGYAPAPTCTPSRCSIQFGKTPARLKQTVVHDVLAAEHGIDCRDQVSLAEMVKRNDARYVTAHFGKWGFPPRKPEEAGYDRTDGNTNNGDGDYLDPRTRQPLPPDDPKRIFSVTERACRFVAEQAAAKRPFFLQVSHYAVHVRHQARPQTIERLRSRPPAGRFTERDLTDPHPEGNASGLVYAAMIEDLDEAIGRLLDELEAAGVADRTYVFFTSDNGGGFRGNGPLRGGKAQLWEGGLRVPFIVAGPGVEGGRWCDVPVAAWDIWATIHDLMTGRSPPDGIDGISLRPLFRSGAVPERLRDRALVFHFPWYAGHPMSAIRRGRYKLIRSLNTGEVRLFDLLADLGERHDLAAERPELARRLSAELDAYLQAVDAERIEDMRAARRRELERYIARDRAALVEAERRLATAGDSERGRLEQQVAFLRQRLAAHRNGLRQLEESARLRRW
ncbi:MAG: sulfatase 1 precursor [Planctomycetota bacterium]|nr:MAG: sulfatase 1 precursor [Planctomycetota bacterium]